MAWEAQSRWGEGLRLPPAVIERERLEEGAGKKGDIEGNMVVLGDRFGILES